MGNCLFLKYKVSRVMKPDGKIMGYESPIEARHVLSEFSRRAAADHLHLHPDLAGPGLYYPLPLPEPSPKPVSKRNKSMEKRVRFSDDARDGPGVGAARGGAVRLKLVISKQELRAMMGREEVSNGWAPPSGCVVEAN